MASRRQGSGTPRKGTAQRTSAYKRAESAEITRSRSPTNQGAGGSRSDVPLTVAYVTQKALVSQYLEGLISQGEVEEASGGGIQEHDEEKFSASKNHSGNKRSRETDSNNDEDEEDEDDVTLDVMSATTKGLPAKDRIKEACRTLTHRINSRLGDITHAHQAAMEVASERIINDEFLVLKQMTDDFAEGVELWKQEAQHVVTNLVHEQDKLKGYLEATQNTLKARREQFEELNRQRARQFEADITALLAESEIALADVLPPESRTASLSLGRPIGHPVAAVAPSSALAQPLPPAFHGQSPHSTSAYTIGTPLPPPHNLLHTAPRSRAPSLTPPSNSNTARSIAPSVSLGRSNHTNIPNLSSSRPNSRSPAATFHHGPGNNSAIKNYAGATERRFASLQPNHPTQAPPHPQGMSHSISATRALNKSLSALAARSASHVSETQRQASKSSHQASRAASRSTSAVPQPERHQNNTNKPAAKGSLKQNVVDVEFGDVVNEDELFLGDDSQSQQNTIANINIPVSSRSQSRPLVANPPPHNSGGNPFFMAASRATSAALNPSNSAAEETRVVARPLLGRFEEEAAQVNPPARKKATLEKPFNSQPINIAKADASKPKVAPISLKELFGADDSPPITSKTANKRKR